VSRSNPGRLLSESPEPPEPDVTEDNGDVIVVHEDDESVSGCAMKERKEDVGSEEPEHFGSTTVVAASSGWDEVRDEAIEDLTVDNPVRRLAYGDFSCENTTDGVEEDGGSAKAVYVPDDDLFKNRWFPDPWNRPPGQIWTKEIQNQQNLATAIRQRGFTGRRAAWLFNQLRKRKGYRFPYQERVSLKRPGQTPAQYLAALRKRREEEHSYENQVKEYDEEKAVEECEWTLDLFNKVYGPGWPEAAAKAISSEADQTLAEDYTDGHEEEEEWTMETRQKTRRQSSRPESPKRKKSTAANHGITLASADQMASPQEIAKRNRDFRSYKARKMEAARVQREKEDVRDFMQSVNHQTFSNGHKEM
jgi:hypothetical protein